MLVMACMQWLHVGGGNIREGITSTTCCFTTHRVLRGTLRRPSDIQLRLDFQKNEVQPYDRHRKMRGDDGPDLSVSVGFGTKQNFGVYAREGCFVIFIYFERVTTCNYKTIKFLESNDTLPIPKHLS